MSGAGNQSQKQRRSKCADEARRHLQERIWRMSPLERIGHALSLGRRIRRFREAVRLDATG